MEEKNEMLSANLHALSRISEAEKAKEKKKKPGRPKGSKNKPKVKTSFRARALNTDAATDERTYYCTCCGKGYKIQKSNFFVSSSILFKENNGYIPVCKICVNKYFAQLKEFFLGDISKAIERCCQIFDWYYSTKAMESLTNSVVATNSEVSSYVGRLNVIAIKNKGSDYLQTLIDKDAVECRINSYEDLETYNQQLQKETDDESEEKIVIERYKVTPQDVKKWGEGYTPEEFEYLETQYAEWTKTLEEQTDKIIYDRKVMDELVKNICKSLLTIRRYQSTNSDKLSSAMKTFQDLLDTCNLKPTLVTESGNSNMVPYGVLIQKCEETEPIGEPNPEWQDVDNIRKYINTWYFGGLAKAVHLNNPNTQLYEEAVSEFEKYTVDLKKEKIVGDVSIFDNITNPQENPETPDDVTMDNGQKDTAELVEKESFKMQ